MVGMISKINAVVLEAMQNLNPEFNKLTINNNLLSYENEVIDLETFNLDTLFESYQLKLDLSNMTAEDLFTIIKLNAITFLSNETGEV